MRIVSPVLALLFLAACGSRGDTGSEEGPARQAASEPVQAASTAPPPASGDAGAPDFTPPRLTPEAEKGEKGARNVLLSWAAAMENRAFAAAYALYGRNGPASGQSAADYAAAFAQYRRITATIGNGTAEGAAGSLYYTVPVTLTGAGQDGASYRREGTITLRRVNDVPGAQDWQLAWHIERIDWQDEADPNAP